MAVQNRSAAFWDRAPALASCDSDDRRARSDRELVCGRRCAYAPDATGRAEWRFDGSSKAGACNRLGGRPLPWKADAFDALA
jgi:hypothetical protein